LIIFIFIIIIIIVIRFLNISNVFLLITSTILIFCGIILISWYHMLKLEFWSAYFYWCPMLMLSLGIYTFATTCYGFIISVKESRGLLTVMAVLLSIAFLGQLASVFTAMMLRTDLETEIANVGNVVSDMKKYDSEDGYTKANWDSLQSSLRCCGGKDYEVGFRTWDVVQVNGVTGQNVPDSCCHIYSEGCGRGKVTVTRTSALSNDIGIWKANWDSLQSSLRCCGGKDYEVGFRTWDVVQVNGVTGQNVPDSCCHIYSEGCGRGKVVGTTFCRLSQFFQFAQF